MGATSYRIYVYSSRCDGHFFLIMNSPQSWDRDDLSSSGGQMSQLPSPAPLRPRRHSEAGRSTCGAWQAWIILIICIFYKNIFAFCELNLYAQATKNCHLFFCFDLGILSLNLIDENKNEWILRFQADHVPLQQAKSKTPFTFITHLGSRSNVEKNVIFCCVVTQCWCWDR